MKVRVVGINKVEDDGNTVFIPLSQCYFYYDICNFKYVIPIFLDFLSYHRKHLYVVQSCSPKLYECYQDPF